MCISLCCIAFSVMKLDYANRNLNFYLVVAMQIVILVVCIYLFVKKRPDYLKLKEKYISDWKEIQAKEQK